MIVLCAFSLLFENLLMLPEFFDRTASSKSRVYNELLTMSGNDRLWRALCSYSQLDTLQCSFGRHAGSVRSSFNPNFGAIPDRLETRQA
jgi:hypothetical protein